MFNRFEPHDLIAVLLIAAALFLNVRGDTVLSPMLLSTIIGFYYGKQAGSSNQNEP